MPPTKRLFKGSRIQQYDLRESARGSPSRVKKSPGKIFTIEDTAGCSYEQIIAEQGLGKGHEKHGCSISAMEEWVDLVNP